MAQVLKEHKREAIIKATVDLMYERGVNNTDMRSIAKESNITVGNLYRYFKDKQELVNTILTPVLERIEKVLLDKSKGFIMFLNFDSEQSVASRLSQRETITVITETFNELYYINKVSPRLVKILLGDETTISMIKSWVESLYLTGNIINKYQEILLKIQVDSVIAGLIAFLKEARDLTYEEFTVINQHNAELIFENACKIYGGNYEKVN